MVCLKIRQIYPTDTLRQKKCLNISQGESIKAPRTSNDLHKKSYKKQELLTLHGHLSSLPAFWWCPCFSSFQFLCVVLLCVFTFGVPCCDVFYNFCIKMFGSSLPPVVCRMAHVLFTLFVFVVSNTYCFVFVF